MSSVADAGTCPGGCGPSGSCVASPARPNAAHALFDVSALPADEAIAYRCSCASGFKGEQCEATRETSCSNNIDDDGGTRRLFS